jgi:hypothetical protein
MSYSNPRTISHHTGVITTTDAAVTIPISGPKGAKGRLIDIIARCSTTHVLGSTPTQLKVGVTGTLTAYAAYLPPAMTAPDINRLTALPGASAITLRDIPADTDVLLTTVANATGSPAGVINYEVIIDWYGGSDQ